MTFYMYMKCHDFCCIQQIIGYSVMFRIEFEVKRLHTVQNKDIGEHVFFSDSKKKCSVALFNASKWAASKEGLPHLLL